ncbi:MAG: alpha/beta hydrolase [Oscillospiraceae bacterium]|jgi:pimeloyl-ACP methyl ester carboxylesterase|nr:alpha/beta hydrolase [Oscillospiraceae bacterium]
MRKVRRALLSIVLAAGMLFPLLGQVVAVQDTAPAVPRIYVHGYQATPLYAYYHSKVSNKRLNVSTDQLAQAIKKALPKTLFAVATAQWTKAVDACVDVTDNVFSAIATDADGESLNPNITTRPSDDPTFRLMKEQPYYNFRYDYRLDPLKSADQLAEYIDAVKAGNYCDKVALLAHSAGGTVVMSYLAKYGNASVDGLVLMNAAHNGLDFVGQGFAGKIGLDPATLAAFMANDSLQGSLIYSLYEKLRGTGLEDTALRTVDHILKNAGDDLMRRAILPYFATSPMVWAFVPDEYYEAAKRYVFGNDKAQYAKLITRIDDYHYTVQVRTAQLLTELNKTGAKVAIIASYGAVAFPVTQDVTKTGDMLIDLAHASSGATVAKRGETLGENYRQQVLDGHNHLSPDGLIDASGAVLPEQTWFLKNNNHEDILSNKMTDWLLTGKRARTVFDNEEYPQFLTRSSRYFKRYLPTLADTVPRLEEKRGAQ